MTVDIQPKFHPQYPNTVTRNGIILQAIDGLSFCIHLWSLRTWGFFEDLANFPPPNEQRSTETVLMTAKSSVLKYALDFARTHDCYLHPPALPADFTLGFLDDLLALGDLYDLPHEFCIAMIRSLELSSSEYAGEIFTLAALADFKIVISLYSTEILRVPCQVAFYADAWWARTLATHMPELHAEVDQLFRRWSGAFATFITECHASDFAWPDACVETCSAWVASKGCGEAFYLRHIVDLWTAAYTNPGKVSKEMFKSSIESPCDACADSLIDLVFAQWEWNVEPAAFRIGTLVTVEQLEELGVLRTKRPGKRVWHPNGH